MRVLLPIKPEYANKIFDGSKKFEFRKSIFKRDNITDVVVYVSSPIMKVIGEFEIDTILARDPDLLWEETKINSGVSKSFYDLYFKNKDLAYAIKIKSSKKYKQAKDLKVDFNIDFAPQSFVYLDK